jgi:hypothetical protein
MKCKPMYMFMNMLFQKLIEPRPTEPTPEGAGFAPREHERDFNHDHDYDHDHDHDHDHHPDHDHD